MDGCAGFRVLLRDRAVLLSLAMAAVVFVIDLFTPLGVASGIPYTLAVLVALTAASDRYPPAFALLCGTLTILDLFLGADRGQTEMWKVLTNRALTLFMISMTTLLGMRRRWAEEKRRQAEEQTRLHLADLAHMGRLKTAGQLAAGLAHELNQPLAAVSLQAEVAALLAQANRPQDSAALLTALREVTEQSLRAAGILRTLRNLVEKGKMERAPIDLNDVVRDVARLIEVQTRRAEVVLTLRLASVLPRVLGDRIQLEQVLLNLLQNAIEAVMAVDGGPRKVEVETSVVEGVWVRVAVCDTGVGLRADEVERIFERFYTTKPNGMGVGLALSRSIVEAHGGRIDATPNPPRGASFTFILPVVRGM